MSFTTRETSCRKLPIGEARKRGNRVAPADSRRTIGRRRSRLRADRSPEKPWSMRLRLICRTAILRWRICLRSSRYRDRLQRRECKLGWLRRRCRMLLRFRRRRSLVGQALRCRNQAALAASAVAPAPEVAHDARRSSALTTNATVIAPAPNVSADKLRAANAIASTVVAPAPAATPRDLASSRAQMSQTTDIVAPPVSAPTRDLSSTAKLSLPAQAVVAPPPSASHEINSWGSARSGDLRSQPVPPPPSASSGGTQAGGRGRSGSGTLAAEVVPPPASIAGNGSGSGANGRETDAAELDSTRTRWFHLLQASAEESR